MKEKIPFAVGLACGLMLTVSGAALASPFSNDAVEAADSVAKASVRTIYNNLRAEGIPWKKIRDQYMPDILTRSLGTIKQKNYSRDVIMNDFIPALLNGYYSEIDKINKENRITCIEYSFILSTIVPFIHECEIRLGSWRITVAQITEVVLNVSYPYTVCSVPSCRSKVKEKFSSEFNSNYHVSKFSKICSD